MGTKTVVALRAFCLGVARVSTTKPPKVSTSNTQVSYQQAKTQMRNRTYKKTPGEGRHTATHRTISIIVYYSRRTDTQGNKKTRTAFSIRYNTVNVQAMLQVSPNEYASVLRHSQHSPPPPLALASYSGVCGWLLAPFLSLYAEMACFSREIILLRVNISTPRRPRVICHP